MGPHVLTQAGTALELPSRLHLVATGAALELQAQRGDDGRIAVQQRVDGVVRPTAAHSPAFPLGLGGAVRVRVLRLDGSVVLDEWRHLCPNAAGQARRVDPLTGVPGAVVAAEVPWSCGYVLARSALWELGRDRAVPLRAVAVRTTAQRPLAAGRHRLEVTLDPDGVLTDADRANNAVAMDVVVRAVGRRSTSAGSVAPSPLAAAPRATRGSITRTRAGATVSPQLPDLLALPPASVRLRGTRLSFDSMIANVGPGSFVVRGTGRLRRPGRQHAQQLLTSGSRVVGRRPVDDLVDETRDEHGHWHLDHVARYRLRDASGRVVRRSGKVGFCLVNSLPVAMGLDSPRWTLTPPFGGDCARRRPSMRIDPGWGDLYYQDVAGQALDVGGLANGVYRLEMEVNPRRTILELTRANDLAGRIVVLGGGRGARTLDVPPVGGVDTLAELALAHTAGAW